MMVGTPPRDLFGWNRNLVNSENEESFGVRFSSNGTGVPVSASVRNTTTKDKNMMVENKSCELIRP
jgi:hypothetical protein